MNKYKNCLTLLLLLIGLYAGAQQSTQTKEPSYIWLINSENRTVKEPGAMVNRSYFAADKVSVGSNDPGANKNDRYYVIFYGTKGNVVQSFDTSLLTDRLKETIQKLEPGTKVVFTKMSGDVSLSIDIILQ